MKHLQTHYKQIALLTAVFFVPVALLVTAFFQFSIQTFESSILGFDQVVFDYSPQAAEVSPLGGLPLNERDSLDQGFDEDDEALSAWLETAEQDIYNSTLAAVTPVFVGLLLVVFALSFVAAYLVVRPLAAAVARQQQFIADASHEIKTPLALLRSEVELFDQQHATGTPTPAEYQTLRRHLLSDIDRLTKLVGQLLAMARGDARPVHTTDTLPAAAYHTQLQAAVSRFAGQHQEHTMTYTGDATATLRVGSAVLQQVVDVLIENACLHTPAGTTVAVTTADAGRTVRLQVRDTGPGIVAHHLPHVFDRFYRVDAARTAGGTGLGLALLRDTVTSLGGSVSVASAVGEGTTFTVSLPVA